MTEYRFTPRVFVRYFNNEWIATCFDFKDVDGTGDEMLKAIDRCFLTIAAKVIADEAMVPGEIDQFMLRWIAAVPIVGYTNNFDITVEKTRWRIEGLDVRRKEQGTFENLGT
jgi:hypothetical protein